MLIGLYTTKVVHSLYNTICEKTKSTFYWALNYTSIFVNTTSDTIVKEEVIINTKPVIILDVDGVILDFAAGFRYWWNVEKQYRKKYKHVVPPNPSDWHFDFKGDRQVIYLKIAQYINTKPMLSLFDMTIPQSLRELRKHFKIIIVTAYPHRESRIKNLALYGIRMAHSNEDGGEDGEYDELHCCYRECKVTKMTSFKNIAFIVEDCPDHVIKLVKQGYTVYAPSHWNYLQEVFIEYEKNKHSYPGTLINYQRFDHVANVESQLQSEHT